MDSPDTISTALSNELEWLRDVSAKGSTDLNQLLVSVLELANSLAAAHDVQLQLEMDPALPTLAANQVALNQTLLNLLTVAIRRADANPACSGIVRVSAQPTRWGSTVEIDCDKTPSSVQITEDDRESLEMATQLAELSGGRLSLDESKDRFHAKLMLQAIERFPVLLIDDNEDALRLMQRYASGTPFQLIGSSIPSQVIPLVEEHTPQVIVLDVMMPDVSGWNILTELRSHPITKDLPVIMCTILPQEELAQSLGASGYIRKPVMRQTFLDALNQAAAQMAPEFH